MMIFNPGDIVVVPFPFVDKARSKPRPALVLSAADFNQEGLIVLSMITSVHQFAHPFDIALKDLTTTGLKTPSVIRWKIFSLDCPLIKKKIGTLSNRDKITCAQVMKTIFPNNSSV
ncbi:MAG: type II toxin-antitoxin system PemK/MazF family toxin [Fidelibacterota bacterium]